MDFPLLSPDTHFSGDSILTVAIMDALLAGDRNYKAALLEWGRRYPGGGYGGRFFRWLSDPDPLPYNGWSNGSAMRVSPISWAFSSEREVLQEAERSASVTHNHPDGIQGAQAVAWTIFHARNGVGAEALRAGIARQFNYDVYRSVELIRPDYAFDSTCAGSVPEAILCGLEATSVEHAVRLAVSLGGDSNTQANIAGAIAEARFGFPAPFQKEVLWRLDPYLREVVLRFEEKFRSRVVT